MQFIMIGGIFMRGIWKKGIVTALTAALLAGNIGGMVPMGCEKVSVKTAEVKYVPVNQEFEERKTAYFELTEGGVVTFEDSGSEAKVSLFKVTDDENEVEYANYTSRLRLDSGKYKVVGFEGSWFDKIKFIQESAYVYEKEWNDTLDTANELYTNILYTGNLNQMSTDWCKVLYYSEDKDYYKFKLEQNGTVQIQYSIESLNYGQEYGAENENKIILYNEDEEGNISKVCEIGESKDKTKYSKKYRLPKGIYYILIEEYVDAYSRCCNIADYHLKVNYEPETSDDHEQEYNNTKDTANEISINQGYIGNIPTENDKDYYKFTIPSTSRVKLKMQVPRQSEDGLFHTVLYKADATSKITDMKTTTNPNVYSTEQILGAGTYYILVEKGSTIDDKVDYTLTVNATEMVAVQEITISPDKAPVYAGESFKMIATVTPDNADNKAVTWTSSDVTVAVIDQNGNVTCTGVGNVYITAVAKDGSGISARFLLSVVKRGTSTDVPVVTRIPSVTKKPQITQAPSETKTPSMTAEPIVTSLPVSTKIPVITEQPIVTKVPVMTKAPVITETPIMTKMPVVTEMPLLTKEPIMTKIPNVTGTPILTKAPLITEIPIITEVPKTPIITEIPIVTEAPIITEIPFETEIPLMTEKPLVTKMPLVTERPDVTKTAIPTILPQSSEQPTMTPEVDTEIPDIMPIPTESTSSENDFENDYVKSIVIAFDLEEEAARVGEHFYVYAEIKPERLEDTEVIWSTSNKKIATVNKNGKVTCVDAGTVTITATATDGSNVSASIKVTVLKAKSKNNYLSKLSISQGKLTPAFKKTRTSYSLTLNKTMSRVTIKATQADKNAVITIDGKKLSKTTVKLKSGQSKTVTIKVKAENGKTKTYKVRVKRK